MTARREIQIIYLESDNKCYVIDVGEFGQNPVDKPAVGLTGI